MFWRIMFSITRMSGVSFLSCPRSSQTHVSMSALNIDWAAYPSVDERSARWHLVSCGDPAAFAVGMVVSRALLVVAINDRYVAIRRPTRVSSRATAIWSRAELEVSLSSGRSL